MRMTGCVLEVVPAGLLDSMISVEGLRFIRAPHGTLAGLALSRHTLFLHIYMGHRL